MSRRFPLAIVLAAFVSSAAFAQETVVKPRSAFETLPADTTVLLRVASCAQLASKLKSSPFYALKDSPDVKKFLDEIGTAMDEGFSDMRSKLGFDPRDLLDSVEGEFVLAIGGLDKLLTAIAAEIMGAPSGSVKPGDLPVLLQFDAGGSAGKMRENIGKIIAYAVESEGAKKSDEEFQGGKIITLTNPTPAGSDDLEHVYIGEHGSAFLISINRPYLQASMSAMAGASGSALSSNAEFGATHSRIKGGGDVLLFVNLESILSSVRKNVQSNPMFGMIWQLLEAKLFGTQLKNAAMACTFEPGGLRSYSFINDGGAKQGLLGVLDGPTFSTSSPGNAIPADANSFSKVSLNIPRLYSIIKDFAAMAMSMSGNPGADPELFIESQLQINVKDLIESLGSQLTIYSRSGGETSPLAPLLGINNLTLGLELKTENEISGLMEKLGVLSGGAIQAEKFLDRQVYTLDPSSGPASPVIAVADKLLVFSLLASDAQDVIRRQADGKPGIGSSAAYTSLVKGLPASVVGLDYYSQDAYRQALGVLRMLEGELPIPNLEPIVSIIEGGVSYATWVENGLYGESVTRFKAPASGGEEK